MSLQGYNRVYVTVLRHKIQPHTESYELSSKFATQCDDNFLVFCTWKIILIKTPNVFVILQTVWLRTAAGPPQSLCCPGLLRWAWAHKSESQLRLCLPAWARLRHSVMMTSRQYPWTRTGMVSCSKTLLFLVKERPGDMQHKSHESYANPQNHDNTYALR